MGLLDAAVAMFSISCKGKNELKEKEQRISEREIVLCIVEVSNNRDTERKRKRKRERERVKEVVGVQPREVEEQRFEMEKSCVCLL